MVNEFEKEGIRHGAIGCDGKERGTQGFQEIRPLLLKVVERIDELYNRDNQSNVTGVPTGFIDLDIKTSGLQRGDLIVVASRPSMGKTAFSLNIGEHVAIESGLPVVVFSMGMSGEQLAMRMLGSVGRLEQSRLRTGCIADDEWERVTYAIQKVDEAQLYIDETPALSCTKLMARARKWARQHGKPGLIIIDSLQLMARSVSGKKHHREIAEISHSLKALAMELDCPIIALSQLKRRVEKRDDKRPRISDLPGAGGIEQAADLVLFIYRDEVYNPDSNDKGTAEIIIGKQRSGPIGTVRLTFLGKFTRFENHAISGGKYGE